MRRAVAINTLLIAAAIIFLTVETCLGRRSTFGPDEIVGCCFFLASALLLRFLANRSTSNAILLGDGPSHPG